MFDVAAGIGAAVWGTGTEVAAIGFAGAATGLGAQTILDDGLMEDNYQEELACHPT